MPGWWYTIESTTTKHLLTQFEQACREGLSSDRATRELMRAKSAKQRFPVIEWIKKLDKLQSTAIKMAQRAKKRPQTATSSFRHSMQKFTEGSKSSQVMEKGSGITASPNPSQPNLLATPGRLNDNSRRGSFASSLASDPYDEQYDSGNEGTRTPTYPLRNVSDGSLREINDDASSIENSRRGIIEPPPKGSNLSRKLSLGTRLGPGHLSTRRQESMATMESLGAIDEEQHYVMPGEEEDDEYMYSAAAIRRQMAKNVGGRRGYSDGYESSDAESDIGAPDSASLFEFDPQRTSVYDMHHRGTDSMYFEDDPYNQNNYFGEMPRAGGNVGFGMYTAHEAQEDPEADVHAPLRGHPQEGYVAGLSPPANPFRRMAAGSHLSIASVLGGRDDFALSKVEDNFTDSDGKYFKIFSSDLHKIDPKTSKEELCIEEFIVKCEKEWANDQRMKKLGLENHHHHLGDTKRPGSHFTDDRPMTVSPPESYADEPLFGRKPPTGIKLFLQRRLGDWPVYSFFLALVQLSGSSLIVGSSYRREFFPVDIAYGSNDSECNSALHPRYDLSHYVNLLVVCLPSFPGRVLSVHAIPVLRPRVFPHWSSCATPIQRRKGLD
jgi:alpha-1,3-glucan synthase